MRKFWGEMHMMSRKSVVAHVNDVGRHANTFKRSTILAGIEPATFSSVG